MLTITHLLIFGAVFVIDIIWTIYIRALAQGKVLLASVFSALVYALSVFSFVEVAKNISLLIPAILGSFFGTFVTLKLDIVRKKKKQNAGIV